MRACLRDVGRNKMGYTWEGGYPPHFAKYPKEFTSLDEYNALPDITSTECVTGVFVTTEYFKKQATVDEAICFKIVELADTAGNHYPNGDALFAACAASNGQLKPLPGISAFKCEFKKAMFSKHSYLKVLKSQPE